MEHDRRRETEKVTDEHPKQQETTPHQVALEEWKQLQTIIGRLEGLEFQIRGWLLVLLIALIAALFAHENKLTPPVFMMIGLTAVAMFCFMELTLRMPKRDSINRARVVERALRTGKGYDGPLIVGSLTDGPRINPNKMLHEFLIANVLLFISLWSPSSL